MKFNIINNPLKGSKEVLAIFLFKDGLPKGTTKLTPAIKKRIQEVIDNNEFKGEANEVFLAPKSFLGKQVLALIGLGEEKSFNLNIFKQAVGTAVKSLQSKKFLDFSLIFPAKAWDVIGADTLINQAVIASHKASYEFSDYLQKSVHLKPLKNIYLGCLADIKIDKPQKLIREGEIVGRSVNFTRRLGNLPPIDMTPAYMADAATGLASSHDNLTVTVFGEKEMKKQGMGGLLAVSLGSDQEAKFIILELLNNPASKDVYVVAGKGITFDSGGISIKPSEKMDEMKFDMLGGGAVLGAMKAAAELDLKINLVGLVPASENLPGHRAYRPGDIIRARNGKTIEVLNTDAEGRIVLADALSFASDYKPKLVLDLATLTGACVVALGENYGGVFTRDEEIASLLNDTSKKTGERLWRMPLDDEFKDQMKSKVADVKNISHTRYGGASTGAAFLEYFTDYPWAHLDIAGVAWGEEKTYQSGGATGFGVQLLVELAKFWSK